MLCQRLFYLLLASSSVSAQDTRNIDDSSATVIGGMDQGYADQPYCIVLKGGNWLCTATHNPGHEGGFGEAVYTSISTDQGKTWTKAAPLEDQSSKPLSQRTAYAYSTLFESRSGRIYNIYVQNYQNVTTDPNTGKRLPREDMMGGFFLKYSDDGGKSWSKETYDVPVRETSIDRRNMYGGTTRMNWLVDKGFAAGDGAYFAMTKIGVYLVGPPTSGWVLHSPNIVAAARPEDIQWTTLPDDDGGVRQYNETTLKYGCGDMRDPPANITSDCIASESHVVPLDRDFFRKGSGSPRQLYVCFRTVSGYMGAQVSYDGGHTFQNLPAPTKPGAAINSTDSHPWAMHGVDAMSHATGARPLKQPRGPMTPRRIDTARLAKPGGADFIMLFYNDGIVPSAPHIGSWDGRNPYWLVPGWISYQANGEAIGIEWGEPEVGLFVLTPTGDTDRSSRIGYPDFIQDTTPEGTLRLWITETAKVSAKVHPVSARLVESLLYQRHAAGEPSVAALASFDGTTNGTKLAFNGWPRLSYGVNATVRDADGLAITVRFSGKGDGVVGSGSRAILEAGGVALSVADGALRLAMHDASSQVAYALETDKQCSAWLQLPGPHFAGFSVDGSARIVGVVVDGVLCDGGAQGWKIHPERGDLFQGWGFLPPKLSDLGEPGPVSLGAFDGEVRLYGERLLHGELIAAARARQ